MNSSPSLVRVFSIILLAALVCGCARNRGNLFNEDYDDEDYDSRVTAVAEVAYV